MSDEKFVLKRNVLRRGISSDRLRFCCSQNLLYLELSRQVDNCSTVMLMVKRDRVEIMADILGLCSEPQTKTQVMYGTNLSWKMLQHYLFQLQSLVLLQIHDKSTKYVTTQRGQECLEKWRELKELLE